MRMSVASHIFPVRWKCLPALCLVLLAGCDAARVPSSPETRAREFIEVAVRDLHNSERLAQLAGDPDYPRRAGLDSAPLRVSLDYLRTRQAQGAALEFKSGRAQDLDGGAQRVPVTVQVSPDVRVGFDVELEPAGDGWRIRRVAAAD
jgi:hypothetical protein